jgi:hypothetical protein
VGAHRLTPRIQDDHELDFGIILFSHYLIENPLNPRVLRSWIRSSEAIAKRLINYLGLSTSLIAGFARKGP